MTWKADDLKIALFSAPSVSQIGALDAWTIISKGQEPDSFQRSGMPQMGGAQASGLLNDFSVAVTTQPGRIDIIYEPIPVDQGIAAPPQIQNIKFASELLVSQAVMLLPMLTVVRVAMVCQTAKYAETVEGAVEELKRKSGASFPEGSRDLIYQYNLRKNLQVAPEVSLNRVKTWVVGAKQMMTISADFSNGTQMPSGGAIYPISALKFDYNTATRVDIASRAEEIIYEISIDLLHDASSDCLGALS